MASPKTPARRYTETKVPILDSQLELKVLMQDARDVGLSEPEWQAAGGRAFVLRFRIDGRPCGGQGIAHPSRALPEAKAAPAR